MMNGVNGMPMPTKHNRRYMAGLDGLRAIAVLSVIFYHLYMPWAPGGLLGVTIFFVLSGYLITDLLIMEWKETNHIDLKQFWLRRIRRLIPAMVTTMFFVTAYITFFNQSLLSNVRKDFLAALLYFSNWSYIFRDVSYFETFETPSLFTHFWSLAIEEQFYLLWPLVMMVGLTFMTKRGHLFRYVMMGAVLSALWMAILYEPGTDPSRVYYGTDTRAFSLLIGAALAIIWPSNKLATRVGKQGRLFLDVIGFVGLVIVMSMLCFSSQYDAFLYRGGMFIISIAAAMLIAALVHPASRIGLIMGVRPLQWIGVRSYGMYLWHYPIIILTTPAVNTGEIHPVRMIVQLFLTVLFASLSWEYIENPIRKGAIKKWWQTVRSGYWGLKHIPPLRWLVINSMMFVIIIASVGLYIAPQSEAKSAKQTEAVKETVQKETPAEKETPISSKKVAQAAEEKQVEIGQRSITVIGDSVVIDATPYLQSVFSTITIDAKVGRQMSEVATIIQQLQTNQRLGEVVVISLGTNGPFSKKKLTSVLQSMGNKTEVYLVNTRVPRPWESVVNDDLNEVAEAFSNVTVINWYEASIHEPQYFAGDGVHLTKTGAEAYATLVEKYVTNKK